MGIVVVIPAYKEEFLLLSLMSLKKCDLPLGDVEVIIVINDSEVDTAATKALNQKVFQQTLEWCQKNSTLRRKFRVIYQDNLPKKFGGVGLARKIGMDEACFRLEKARNKKGIIVCFDADSRCAENYLVEIEKHFQKHPKTPACSIHFEHPLRGFDYDPEVYEAIMYYELHLRYFIGVQRLAGCPFAYQTIGSSMAVRADFYQKQGGMNRRKAGEDFYFLQKMIALGNFTELNTTTVFPSPRISDRVPFGTGKAVGEIVQQKGQYLTYNPLIFKDLATFFGKLETLYTLEGDWESIALPPSITDYLASLHFEERLAEIRGNTSNLTAFKKRFFRWFNAFQVMKYAHFARDHFYENIPVTEAARDLLSQLGIPTVEEDVKRLLITFRKLDRERAI
ncbi:MAG: glycosyltransferase family 2 protein [Bacteroidota bacterium]